MKSERLLKAIGEIDVNLIHSAESDVVKTKKPAWVKWKAMAACFFLCVLLGIGIWQSGILDGTAPDVPHATADGAPQLALNGTTYMISPHLSLSESIPDGFSYAGQINVIGVGDSLPYYTSTNIPEWVYVLQEVRTTGKVDETGTMISAEPHDAYVRYVILPLRGKDLLCCDGKQYVSMWSVGLENVDEGLYNAVNKKYGVRIEGAVPSGFTLKGSADFSGYDTIPRGVLSMNTPSAEVYLSNNEPEIALVATKWYTAPDNSGESLHTGFDVYIRWEYIHKKEVS